MSQLIDNHMQNKISVFTTLYAPPEYLIYFLSGKSKELKEGPKNDIWSFGLIVYRVFYEKKPTSIIPWLQKME